MASSWLTLIQRARKRLADAEIIGYDARELAEYLGARPPFFAEVSPEESAAYEELLVRREAHEPLQHITGRMYFRALVLQARPGVFAVRPETESIIDLALEYARAREGHGEELTIVDLCTGSGAIAIAAAEEIPCARVWAVELSEEAFTVAQENNARYGGKVHLVQADARTALAELAGSVDILLTNPPYIPAGRELSAEVLRDPSLALWGGGNDGLEMPQALVARGATLLKAGGVLVMEHDDTQGSALVKCALAQGYASAYTHADLAGRDRFLVAKRPL